MVVEVKALLPGDEAVLNHVADVFDRPLNTTAVREYLADPRHHITVAIDAGVVVAFATGVHQFHPDRHQPDLFINEVGVAQSHWRRGLGKAVLNALLEVGKDLGCAEAWVITAEDNTAANALYSSAGGTPLHAQVMYSFALAPNEGAPEEGAPEEEQSEP